MLLGLGPKNPIFSPFSYVQTPIIKNPLDSFWSCDAILYSMSHMRNVLKKNIKAHKIHVGVYRIYDLLCMFQTSYSNVHSPFPLPKECIEDFITIVTSFPSFCADMKGYPLQHKRLLVSDMCPDWLSTLNRRDASFARSLTSRNRADWNHIMCDQ